MYRLNLFDPVNAKTKKQNQLLLKRHHFFILCKNLSAPEGTLVKRQPLFWAQLSTSSQR